MKNNFFFNPTLQERAANDLHFSQKLLKNKFVWRRNEFLKKTFEIPKIRIAHISKFLVVFEGQKYKIELFTPRAESPEGYYYHDGGLAGGRPCAMSVVPRFFIQFFSYDPEISHACSPP